MTVCAFCGQFEFEQTASAVFNVEPPATPVPPAQPPVILSFTLDAGSINAGSCTTARWTTENGVSAQLTGDFGAIAVELNGTWQLCPPATQLYRLVVNGSPQAKPNFASAEVTLNVIVPPTPTGTSSPTPTSTTRPPTATPLPPTATPAISSGPCTAVPRGRDSGQLRSGLQRPTPGQLLR